MAAKKGVRGPSINAIQPTMYFVEESGKLKQGVDVVVRNPRRAAACHVVLGVGRKTYRFDLGAVPKGTSTHRIYIPDIRQKKQVQFRLLVEGEAVDEWTLEWTPQRHWTVYLVQFAHFDPGYTDLPSNVMDEYLGFLDDVVAWCKRTARWPAESRFRYVVEQAWIAWHYVCNRPPAAVKRFAHYCKTGQIEVNAFWANMTSDHLGAEEAARLVYPAFELKRRYGIPIRTAEHNDVPAMAWSLATALAGAGIKWFAPGIPDYFSARYVGKERAGPHRNFDDALVQPRDCPVAFRWEAQDGQRVLVYLHRQGCGGGVDTNLVELPGVLEQQAAAGYPYDAFLYRLIGGHRDNSPPLFEYVETVKAWNARWAYPKLVMATNSMFFEALEKELGDEVATHRGHWPDTDYALGATSTADDLGVNRCAKDMLVAGERFATVASEVAGFEYPRGHIESAYINALKFDEHAWGMSTHLGWPVGAHGREKGLYAHHAAALADDVLIKSINIIADRVALEDEGRYFVVFNALERPRTDVVEVPFVPLRPSGMPMHLVQPPEGDPRAPYWGNGTVVGRDIHGLSWKWVSRKGVVSDLEVVDVATGENVPYQVVRVPEASFPRRFSAERYSLTQRTRENVLALQLVARDVPALGYRTYKVGPRAGAPAPAASAVRVDGATLENDFYRVRLDETTGAVTSIYDKELDRELLDAGAGYGANELFARGVADGAIERVRDVSVVPVRRGPVAVSLLVKGSLAGAPVVTQEIVLYAGIKRVDFFNRLLKDADGARSYFLAFPFAAKRPRFRFAAGPNVVRPVEDQFPGTTTDYYAAQQWVHIGAGDGDWAVAWSAREAPMVQLGANWPDYVSPAHHGTRPHGFEHGFLGDPAQLEEGHVFSYVAVNNFCTNFVVSQPGPIYTSYSITSHRGDGTGDARRHGEAFCQPMPHAIVLGPQEGPLPAARGFCTIDKPNAAITTIKRAENGDGLIVRLVETEGVETKATVDVPFFKFSRAVQTNLVEEGGRRIPSKGTRFTVRLAPWGVATVRLCASARGR